MRIPDNQICIRMSDRAKTSFSYFALLDIRNIVKHCARKGLTESSDSAKVIVLNTSTAKLQTSADQIAAFYPPLIRMDKDSADLFVYFENGNYPVSSVRCDETGLKSACIFLDQKI